MTSLPHACSCASARVRDYVYVYSCLCLFLCVCLFLLWVQLACRGPEVRVAKAFGRWLQCDLFASLFQVTIYVFARKLRYLVAIPIPQLSHYTYVRYVFLNAPFLNRLGSGSTDNKRTPLAAVGADGWSGLRVRWERSIDRTCPCFAYATPRGASSMRM